MTHAIMIPYLSICVLFVVLKEGYLFEKVDKIVRLYLSLFCPAGIRFCSLCVCLPLSYLQVCWVMGNSNLFPMYSPLRSFLQTGLLSVAILLS